MLMGVMCRAYKLVVHQKIVQFSRCGLKGRGQPCPYNPRKWKFTLMFGLMLYYFLLHNQG